jgi:hypothetical protein
MGWSITPIGSHSGFQATFTTPEALTASTPPKIGGDFSRLFPGTGLGDSPRGIDALPVVHENLPALKKRAVKNTKHAKKATG